MDVVVASGEFIAKQTGVISKSVQNRDKKLSLFLSQRFQFLFNLDFNGFPRIRLALDRFVFHGSICGAEAGGKAIAMPWLQYLYWLRQNEKRQLLRLSLGA